jgi:F0F1-type ATP synthase gamma subunit
MLENNCSEHASRMSAMENSTKSAGDMLSALTLAYNRCDPCCACMPGLRCQ